MWNPEKGPEQKKEKGAKVPCGKCGGSGKKEGENCKNCSGTGYVLVR